MKFREASLENFAHKTLQGQGWRDGQMERTNEEMV